jgi:hypothetical protein
MRVTWDPIKARLNLRAHGIRFADAEGVLFDPFAISAEDPAAMREQRFVSIGADARGHVLVVVYTYREDQVRLISARRPTRKERLQYEEGIRL